MFTLHTTDVPDVQVEN